MQKASKLHPMHPIAYHELDHIFSHPETVHPCPPESDVRKISAIFPPPLHPRSEKRRGIFPMRVGKIGGKEESRFGRQSTGRRRTETTHAHLPGKTGQWKVLCRSSREFSREFSANVRVAVWLESSARVCAFYLI